LREFFIFLNLRRSECLFVFPALFTEAVNTDFSKRQMQWSKPMIQQSHQAIDQIKDEN